MECRRSSIDQITGLVPGLTDDDANVDGIARFVATLTTIQRVQVLPFHRLAEHEYALLGITFQLQATSPPTATEMARARELFAQNGGRAE